MLAWHRASVVARASRLLHSADAALAAFAAADDDRHVLRHLVAFLEREPFAAPQAGASVQDDECSEALR